MSRRDSADEYDDSLSEPPVATTAHCADCGDPYVAVAGDPLCDVCAEARDAHTSALETRWKESA